MQPTPQQNAILTHLGIKEKQWAKYLKFLRLLEGLKDKSRLSGTTERLEIESIRLKFGI